MSSTDEKCQQSFNLKVIFTIISILTFLVPRVAIAQPPVVEKQVVEIVKTNLPSKCIPFLAEIEKYDWDTVVASKIMFAESACNPQAVNKKDNHKKCLGSYGLFQVSCTTTTSTDPATNIRLAYEEKYKKGGFKHWSVCKSVGGKPPKVNCGL